MPSRELAAGGLHAAMELREERFGARVKGREGDVALGLATFWQRLATLANHEEHDLAQFAIRRHALPCLVLGSCWTSGG